MEWRPRFSANSLVKIFNGSTMLLLSSSPLLLLLLQLLPLLLLLLFRLALRLFSSDELRESTRGQRFKKDDDAAASSQVVTFAADPDRNFRNSEDFQPRSSVGVRFLKDEAEV